MSVSSPLVHSSYYISLAVVIVEPPEFDVFPTSPHHVLHNDTMILHVEITSGTERIALTWQHCGKNYTEFIYENPFCTEAVSTVCSHFHTNRLDAARGGVQRGFGTHITMSSPKFRVPYATKVTI